MFHHNGISIKIRNIRTQCARARARALNRSLMLLGSARPLVFFSLQRKINDNYLAHIPNEFGASRRDFVFEGETSFLSFLKGGAANSHQQSCRRPPGGARKINGRFFPPVDLDFADAARMHLLRKIRGCATLWLALEQAVSCARKAAQEAYFGYSAFALWFVCAVARSWDHSSRRTRGEM